MTEDVRKALITAIDQQGTRAEFAAKVDMRPENLSRLLAGRGAKVPTTWAKMLHEAGLVLTAIPKR